MFNEDNSFLFSHDKKEALDFYPALSLCRSFNQFYASFYKLIQRFTLQQAISKKSQIDQLPHDLIPASVLFQQSRFLFP